MKIKKILTLIIVFFIIGSSQCSYAQWNGPDTTQINKKRLIPTLAVVGGSYAVAMVGLNFLWYANSPRSSFHFFDDNSEWQQVDKCGHFMTAFHESRLGVDLMKWSGLPRKKAIIYGSLAGFIFQTPIEVFDGFSSEYGASLGDESANILGSAGVLTQYLLWNEIRIQPKISFHHTGFAAQRPNELGSTLLEQGLKDYNGQTYWLSGNIYSFLPKESKFPKWLNIAVGYGAENMIYAQKQDNINAGYDTYRQWYLSLDIDMTKIKTNNSFLKKLFYTINMVKIPAPALELNKYGLKFHAIYF